MNPSVLVLRAPGTNCDVETAYAFEQAGAVCERLHINRVLERPAVLETFQILCLPGGFSFGDDIAAGRIMATRFRNNLLEPMRRFKEAGKLILGICNGFQILIKSGLLFEDDAQGPPATLTWNTTGLYMDRWVRLKAAPNSQCVFLKDIESLYLPIAHAEGRFVGRDGATLDALQAAGQLVLRYDGTAPNGAERSIAGACDPSGRLFGLMPHPERYIDPTQHPHWPRLHTREMLKSARADGTTLFRNAVRYFD